jgi:hypothetical protein
MQQLVKIQEYEEMVQELVQLCKASDIVRRQRDMMTYSDVETDEFFHGCNTCEFYWNNGEKQWFQ